MELICPRSQSSPTQERNPGHQASRAAPPRPRSNPHSCNGKELSGGLEEGTVFYTDAGAGLDLPDNVVMVRMALISCSSPQSLWGTPKLGTREISSVLTQRAQEQWGLAYLLSLISVAFPAEITVENTGLEEGKKEMCYKQSPQTLSHPNSLKRKVKSLGNIVAILVCGTLSSPTLSCIIILFDRKSP